MAVNMVLLEAACASCGKAFPEAKLVRLDQHTEIGVCFDCLDRLEEQRQEKVARTVG